jgi:1,2-diacylglycerol 3-alpha-glucosyltransferase
VRIGLFTESYEPVINGVSTSVKTLAHEMRAAGHDPVVVAPRFSGYEDVVGDIDVRRIPSVRTRFNPENPFAVPPLFGPPDALRVTGFDVVHTQQPFGIGLHGRRCARRLGVPHVSTFHTLYTEYVHYFPFLPRPVVAAVVAWHLRRFYNDCDAVIVPSRETGRYLESVGVRPEQLTVIPTGIPEPAPVRPGDVDAVRQRFQLPPCAPVLLYVGRIAPEKHLDLLLDAFADLIAGMPDDDRHPILLLVGGGPHREGWAERIERMGLGKWVRVPGPLPRAELDPIYAAATLFVFPSSTETQGVVLCEAQSHGLPCVAVTGGGAAEFVRNGVDALVVPSDRAAFTAAMRDLLENEAKRCAFAVAARQSPLRLTPAGMAARVVEVYSAARVTAKRHRPVQL